MKDRYKIFFFIPFFLFGIHIISSSSKNINTTDKDLNVKSDFAVVEYVIDGDTIVVKIDNSEKTVRLLGINAPESVDPEKGAECFGEESAQKLKELLSNRRVLLESDSTQALIDKYGRLLRYVYTDDNTLINQIMIEKGYASEYTYDVAYKYQKEFKVVESQARINKYGLWADSACK